MCRPFSVGGPATPPDSGNTLAYTIQQHSYTRQQQIISSILLLLWERIGSEAAVVGVGIGSSARIRLCRGLAGTFMSGVYFVFIFILLSLSTQTLKNVDVRDG